MQSIRDIKRKARRDGHNIMLVPAIYLATSAAEPLRVNVRVHVKFDALGLGNGASPGLGMIRDAVPKIVFDATEVALPARNAFVAISADEIYRVTESDPPDGEFVRADVMRLRAEDAATTWQQDWEALL